MAGQLIGSEHKEMGLLLFSLDGVGRSDIIAGNVALLPRVDGAGLPPVSLSAK